MTAFVDLVLPLSAEIDKLGGGPAGGSYIVEIPGEPRGKQRAGRNRFTGHSYTPAETENAEAWVRSCIWQQVGKPMLAGAVELELVTIRSVPPSWSQRKRHAALSGLLRPTGKPDADNLLKLFCDASNGLLWADDAQVSDATVRKRYGPEAKMVARVRQVMPA